VSDEEKKKFLCRLHLAADPKAEAGMGKGVVGGLGSTSQQTDKVSLLADGQQYWPRPRS